MHNLLIFFYWPIVVVFPFIVLDIIYSFDFQGRMAKINTKEIVYANENLDDHSFLVERNKFYNTMHRNIFYCGKNDDVVESCWFGFSEVNSIKDNDIALDKMVNYVNAIENRNGTPILLIINSGTYNFSRSIEFKRPIVIDGRGSVQLIFWGYGSAFILGQSGLSFSNSKDHRFYEIRNIILSGGSVAEYGIFIRPFIRNPRITNVHFVDFGNINSHAMFFVKNNWNIIITGCTFWNENAREKRNVLRVNGRDNEGSDFGNSHLILNKCEFHQNRGGVGGIGVYVSGTDSIISENKIEGFSPNIEIGCSALGVRISNNYFEMASQGFCIKFGSDCNKYFGGESHLFITGNYCNLHNNKETSRLALFVGADTIRSKIGQTSMIAGNMIIEAGDLDVVKNLSDQAVIEKIAKENVVLKYKNVKEKWQY